MEAIQSHKHYTYADYLTWPDDVRYEIIDGIAYMMAAPSSTHQEISMEVSTQLSNFLRGGSARVYAAPLDVRLNFDSGDDIVLQPDILVVCDRSKIDKRGCNGAPDLVIEILSPSSVTYDMTLKFSKYLQHGVREYWVIDPESRAVIVHIMQGANHAKTHAYKDTDIIPVEVLDGCSIDMNEVFSERGNDDDDDERNPQ